MDKDVERLIHHLAKVVEIRRDVEKDLESNRHRWTETDNEETEATIGAIGLAIEGLDTLKCQIQDVLAKKH